MDLNIFDRKNSILQESNNNFVKNFIDELKDYLDKNISNLTQNKQNVTYAVSSEVNDKGEVFVTARNGTGAGQDVKLSELPAGTEFGTILRWQNGKYVIDENLTEKSISNWDKTRKEAEELVSQYKMEGVDYLVKNKLDDYVELVNQKTGLWFSTSDFYKEDFEKLEKGMILECKNGEYVVK